MLLKQMNNWRSAAALLVAIGTVLGCSGDAEVSGISSQVRPPKNPYKQGGAPKSPLGGTKPSGDSATSTGAAK